MNEGNNLVELIDDDGNTLSFEYLMTIDFGDNEYVVLTANEPPKDPSQEFNGGEVVILRVENDGDQDSVYVSIDDEDELNEVFDAFNQIMAQSEDEGP
ncbi:MAG TPA: DUF1292 domain-containing protein [Clostridia bacterium]|nr:DUF1292 domain-containing protein [Clostridia bacterium]